MLTLSSFPRWESGSNTDTTTTQGPRTWPILGNLHQIPTKRTHLQFARWAEQYGEIYSLKFGLGTCIVVSSPRLITQLVDKKSNLYSWRPASHLIEPDVSNEKGYCSGFPVCAKDFPRTVTVRSEAWRATILRKSDKARVEVFSLYETPKEKGV
ncbi:hypothetical protein C8A01DRAFT_40845 [Parachaetomium inaequale]|uniref:Cytochrome P450 n=1 Tax=Parachaetomium inaequale TaxID=2588326 RepID=A0AAN6P6K3_9PEZI|nr:hypothetical protein C8A01DRAFT_40845 [Parachaetomium inaequale]